LFKIVVVIFVINCFGAKIQKKEDIVFAVCFKNFAIYKLFFLSRFEIPFFSKEMHLTGIKIYKYKFLLSLFLLTLQPKVPWKSETE